MYVSMCLRMYVCMHVCRIRVYIFLCACACVWYCACVDIKGYVRILSYVCMYVSVCEQKKGNKDIRRLKRKKRGYMERT